MQVFIRFFTFCMLILPHFSWGQSTTVGQGAFVGNVFGPVFSSTNSGSLNRHAYMYSSLDLGNLRHGDSISSIAFFKNTQGLLFGTGNMKIYLGNTSRNSFGTSGISWNDELSRTGILNVYDKTPFSDIGPGTGFVTFEFNRSFYFDTSLGQHLQIMIEYRQDSVQSQAINWLFDSPASMTNYGADQTKYFIGVNRSSFDDSLLSSSDRKPMVKINFPRYAVEIGAISLYTLGKIPSPLGNPDTVKILLENNGKFAVNNRRAILQSVGANTFRDTLLFSLMPSETRLFSYPVRYITQVGMDTLYAFVEKDSLPTNDSIFHIRQATEFTYSYRNLLQPPAPGGIGFNGNTGDFVAKFQSTQPKAINQIEVVFGFGGQPFKLGIWDSNGRGGRPGNLLWESDTQQSGGIFTMAVWPPVQVNGSFFVGVRQTGRQNIAFGYQREDPVRNGTFFYASPIDDTNWVDFAPGAPFRFLIEPRIQAENDITPLAVNFPSLRDTLIFGTFDTIAPIATIQNIGSNDQITPFDITCNIRYFGGQLIYTSTKSDTLSAGLSRQIVFDKSFFPVSTGSYTIDIITRLPSDQFKQNDTLRATVLAGILNDVGPTTVFEPDNNDIYEFNIDTVLPTVKVDNFGFNTLFFGVTAEIRDATDSIVWIETQFTNVQGGSSNTIAFKDFIPETPGVFTFMVYTRLANDERKNNDTTIRTFRVRVGNDVSANFAVFPLTNQKLPSQAAIRPIVNIKNTGQFNQFVHFPVIVNLWKEQALMHADTFTIQLVAGDSTQVSFNKTFVPPTDGLYTAQFITLLPSDQLRTNDTLTIPFTVGTAVDLQLTQLLFPLMDSILDLGQTYRPIAEVYQGGFASLTDSTFMVFRATDSTGVVVHEQKKAFSIQAYETRILLFDSTFIARPSGKVDLQVFTLHPRDEFPQNDTLRSIVTVLKSVDFAIDQIPLEQEDQILWNVGTYLPNVKIDNLSRIPTDSAYVTCVIIQDNEQVVYNRTLKTYPSIGEASDTLYFTPFIPAVLGTHHVMFTLFSTSDQNPFNDTLKHVFESILSYDLAPVSISMSGMQSDTFFILMHQQDGVQVRVENLASDSVMMATVYLSLKNAQLQTLYTDSLPFEIGGFSNQWLHFNRFWDDIQQQQILNNTPGEYVLSAEVAYPQPQIWSNNTISRNIYVSYFTSHRLQHSSLEGFHAYPNPFTRSFTIEKQQPLTRANVRLFNAHGQVVYEQIWEEGDWNHTIHLPQLSHGLYWLNIQTDTQTYTRRMVQLNP
jgi:hypothetical protein